MKKVSLLFVLFISFAVSAQSVINNTYLDVPANEISDFLQLHKKVVDMSNGEGRTIGTHWVYRHWYGSDHSIMLADLYPTVEAAVKDDFWSVLNANIEKLSENDKKEMQAVVKKWWSYWNNHTDEIRSINWDNNWIGKENLNLDIPYVFVVGSYNSNAGNQDLIDAYMEWNVKPGVEKGVMLYGGATSHNIGSGSDVQLWSAYTDIAEFAVSNGPNGQVNSEFAPKFWSLVEGAHNDQIYIHAGHTINKEFNFAGKDN
jgi:hypothetical protein